MTNLNLKFFKKFITIFNFCLHFFPSCFRTKGKKGRRPNSAASSSDHNLLHSVPHHHHNIAINSDTSVNKNSKLSDHNISNPDNKVPNNVEQSPTSASSCSAVNTSSSSSSSSSSKQSSTSSLIGKFISIKLS